jgi:hypothetical protein
MHCNASPRANWALMMQTDPWRGLSEPAAPADYRLEQDAHSAGHF